MKTHIAALLEKFDSVSKYQPEDNNKQIQAVALIVALDILKLCYMTKVWVQPELI